MAAESAKPSRLRLIPLFLKVGGSALLRLFISPFRGNRGAPTYKVDVLYAAVRTLLTNLGDGLSTEYAETTDRVYERSADKIGIPRNIVNLSDSAKGHWLGPANAKYVLVFFHGGGYEGYASSGHGKYLIALQKAIQSAGFDFSIFAPTYSLSSVAPYPKQLHDATSAIRYLVEATGRDPQTILVGGDSAGGNLTCELLLHIANPHPEVPPLNLSAPLKGAVLLSPWVSFDTTTKAFKENAESDYLTVVALNRASTAFIGKPPQRDEYSEPVRASAEWWTKVANKACDEMIIWGGGGEVLIDGIRALAKNIKAGYEASTNPASQRIVYVETPRAAHEEQIMHYSTSVTKHGQETYAIEDWIKAKL